METFKERLINERAELNEKIEKLELFVMSDNFIKIEPVQISLLNIQLFAMKTYRQVLIERISYLND